MRNPNPIAEDNLKRYGKPPTWEQIESLVKESGVSSIYHFELYYGLPFNHLAKVKCGLKSLGRAYWHFFYQRIIPERGAGFYRNPPKTVLPKKLTNSIPKEIPTSNSDNHDRTGTLT